MPSVLIGWELGAGSGHIQRLIPIVGAYLQEGWTVVAAVRDVRMASERFGQFRTALDAGHLTVIQAPIFLHRSSVTGPVSSLAEIFAQIGFADAQLLRPVVRAWEQLISRIRPAVILSDASPSLNITANGRVPVMAIGNGWTIPPDLPELPALIGGYALKTISHASAQILEAVEHVSRRGITHFTALLRGAENFVCTFEALDPYQPYRREPYYWSPEIERPSEIPVSDPESKRETALIYLPKGHPAVLAVIKGAAMTPLLQRAYFGGDDPPAVGNLQVSRTPIDFRSAMPGSQLIIHHGGLGTALLGLVHRVPQLICCADLEKILIARGIAASGAGLYLHLPISLQQMVRAIRQTALIVPPPPDYSNLASRSPQQTLDAILATSMMLP